MSTAKLTAKLRSVRGEMRRAFLLDGSARLLASLFGVMFVLILVDCFTYMPSLVRAVMLLGWLGVGGYFFRRYLWGPLSLDLSEDDMALTVEREFPHLNDRLISTIQLRRLQKEEQGVSPVMVERLEAEAVAAAGPLDFRRVVKTENLKPVLWAGGGISAFVVGLGLIFSPYASTGLRRLLVPWSDARYPVRTKIRLLDGSGNVILSETGELRRELLKVPKGETLTLYAVCFGRLPSTAKVYKSYGEGVWTAAERMSPAEAASDQEAKFSYQYGPVSGNFELYVAAGDNPAWPDVHHGKPPLKILAVEPPDIKEILVQYRLPAYVTEEEDPAPGFRPERNLRVLRGALAHLRLIATKPMKTARIRFADAGQEGVGGQWITMEKIPLGGFPEGAIWGFQHKVEETTTYELHLHDVDGFDSKPGIKYQVKALPDHPPKLSVKHPGRSEKICPGYSGRMHLLYEDDHGVAKSEVQWKRARSGTKEEMTGTEEIAGKYFGKKRTHLELTEWRWDLAKLGLRPGDEVSYRLRAEDFRDIPDAAGKMPGVCLTDEYRFQVLSETELRHYLNLERQRLVKELEKIIAMQLEDQMLIHDVRTALKLDQEFGPEKRQDVVKARQLQSQVIRRTDDLAGAFGRLLLRYEDNGIVTHEDRELLGTHPQGAQGVLRLCTEVKMPEANKLIADAKDSPENQLRGEKLLLAEQKQQEILTDLKALHQQLLKLRWLEDLIRAARKILEKEQQLIKEGDALSLQIGFKKPEQATKEEEKQVKETIREQKGNKETMKEFSALLAKKLFDVSEMDQAIARNIKDAYDISQNADATAEEPQLPVAREYFQHPAVADRMELAEGELSRFAFGRAKSRMREAEKALREIIKALKRQDKEELRELLQSLERMRQQLQNLLREQENLRRRTESLRGKEELQREIERTREALQRLREEQQALKDRTAAVKETPVDPAQALQEELNRARDRLEKLSNEQKSLKQQTEETMSRSEKDLSQILSALKEMEAEQKALKDQAEKLDAPGAAEVARALKAMEELLARQEELETKAHQAQKQANEGQPEASREAAKTLAGPQGQLAQEAQEAAKAMKTAAETLQETAGKESEKLAAAAGETTGASDNMKDAQAALGKGEAAKGFRDAFAARAALQRAKDALLVAHRRLTGPEKATRIQLQEHQDKLTQKAAELTDKLSQMENDGRDQAGDAGRASLAAGQAARSLAAGKQDIHNANTHLQDEAMKAAAAAMGAAAKRIAEARQALEGAAQQMAGSGKGQSGEALAGRQGKLAGRTGTFAQQLAQLQEKIAQAGGGQPGSAQGGTQSGGQQGSQQGEQPGGQPASQSTAQAAQNMQNAQQGLGQGNRTEAEGQQSQALENLAAAKKALGELQKKIDELRRPERRLAREQRELKRKARELAQKAEDLQRQVSGAPNPGQEVQNAASSMQKAENQLAQAGGAQSGGQQGGDQQRQEAREAAQRQQEKALSELEEALQKLAELAGKAKDLKDDRDKNLKKLAREQAELSRVAERLRKEMKKLEEKQPSENLKSAANNTESAKNQMQQAQARQQSGDSQGASGNQKQAEDDLKNALEDLEKESRSAQSKQQEKELLEIENALKQIRKVQTDLYDRTKTLDQVAEQLKNTWLHKNKVQKTADDQDTLGGSTRVIVKKLAESPVFRDNLAGAVNDMEEAAKLLAEVNTGEEPQGIQQDVLKVINDLIEALQKLSKEKQEEKQGGGGGGGGKQPLVPPLAELRMLRIMQIDVNKKTQRVDQAAAKKSGELTPVLKRQLRRAASKQGQVKKLTDDLLQALLRQAPPPPTAPQPQPEPEPEK